jgi:cell division septation protein DedD
MRNSDHSKQRNSDKSMSADYRSDKDEDSRDPILDDFEDEDDYEEPDRDTDYASVYTEDIIEDDEFEELLEESRTETEQPEEEYLAASEQARRRLSRDIDPSQRQAGRETPEDRRDFDDEPTQETAEQWSLPDPRDEFPDDFDAELDDDLDWDDDDADTQAQQQAWPLGLIAVAVIALLLLVAGGYGVIQQRSAMELEIQELQAALAQAASPEDVAASRSAVTKMRERYEELRITLNSLNLENRRLRDTVAGLESQLDAQQAVTAKAAAKPAAQPAPASPRPAAAPAKPAAVAAAKPKAAPAVETATPKPTASTSGPGWFVNFGSYSQRGTAESWQKRLQPPGGKVIVSEGNKDGKVFYRVRVVSLSSKDQAERVARQLEKDYGLSRLWVGKQ